MTRTTALIAALAASPLFLLGGIYHDRTWYVGLIACWAQVLWACRPRRTRTFVIKIGPETLQKIELLAQASGMNSIEYLEMILSRAAADRSLFKHN